MAREDVRVRGDNGEGNVPGNPAGAGEKSGWLQLFIIPLLVYIAWLVETYLLGFRAGIFGDPGTPALLLYTLVTCIIIGIVIPVMCIRRAFKSGAVNMHQVGFRPLWRTGPIVLLTVLVLLPVCVFFSPFDADRMAFFNTFLLVLPTAVSAVMVCFVLLGTHVQAFMRDGGIIASISSGVIVTSLLFAFAALARSAGHVQQEELLFALVTGVIISFFFFAFRDIYATVLVAAVCLVFSLAGEVNRQALASAQPALAASAALAVFALLATHAYFSWKYTTVLVKVR